MATETTEPVRLPPGPRLPKVIQGIAVYAARYESIAAMGKRYGPTFTLNIPLAGQTVVVSDPVLVKDLFTTGRDLIGRPKNNLGANILGEGSIFNLEGEELLARRKLLMPPLQGKYLESYAVITEEEVRREMATWPEGREFATISSMNRITLNTILRTVFGAEGPALEELRTLIPAAVKLGAGVALLPRGIQRDFGPWSLGRKFAEYRKRLDDLSASLMAEARSDPDFEKRNDVLSLLLQARDDNGQPISDKHITDELLTLLVAGHETTSTQLAWAVERIRRHPEVLAKLVEEVDAGGSKYRLATIAEVQRTRPVLTAAIRRTRTRIKMGEWVIPEDATVMASTQLAMAAEESFPDARAFKPERFVDQAPNPFAWIPFGGGIMRCIGASFATMEMDVTLRTLLQEFRLEPITAAGERPRGGAVTVSPGRGGRALVYRRADRPSRHTDSAAAAQPTG